MENSLEYIRMLLDPISKLSKIPGNKVNLQILVVLLYTGNEQLNIESEKTVPFIIALKSIKCLHLNLFKVVKSYIMKTTKTLYKLKT